FGFANWKRHIGQIVKDNWSRLKLLLRGKGYQSDSTQLNVMGTKIAAVFANNWYQYISYPQFLNSVRVTLICCSGTLMT
uniref:Uncharacterized protein n=1 Tax=Triticum urartu TaxID=4572 RepID=A0A8R7UTL7_TRIUA